MTKPCHLVVRLGKMAINNKAKYRVCLKTSPNHIFERVLENSGDYMEMTYSNGGDSVWADVYGTGDRILDDGSFEYDIGFGVANFWIGYPQGVVGYTDDLNPNVDGNDYHKFSENETYKWTLEYSDAVNPGKWSRTYTMQRLPDTDAKEFVLWIDD